MVSLTWNLLVMVSLIIAPCALLAFVNETREAAATSYEDICESATLDGGAAWLALQTCHICSQVFSNLHYWHACRLSCCDNAAFAACWRHMSSLHAGGGAGRAAFTDGPPAQIDNFLAMKRFSTSHLYSYSAERAREQLESYLNSHEL